MIKANSVVANMAPYALADLSAPDGVEAAQLAQNECFRPPSPAAVKAAQNVVVDGAMYPDPEWTELRTAIAKVHNLDPMQILCGAGSMELIRAITLTYANKDRPIFSTEFAYAFFKSCAEMFEARYVVSDETNRQVDVDALAAVVGNSEGVVFLANPGNPTGTIVSSEDVRRLRKSLPGHVLLVVDEAYAEFSDEEPLFDLVDAGNTIVLRTFSKAYGMAGFRVGWGVFPPEIAGELRKVMNPNNLPLASQAAATAAVLDQNYMRETCQITRDTGDWFQQQVQAVGIEADKSYTNFVLLRFSSDNICKAATNALWQAGLLARGMGGYGLAHALRITIGTKPEMNRALNVLREFVAEGGLK